MTRILQPIETFEQMSAITLIFDSATSQKKTADSVVKQASEFLDIEYFPFHSMAASKALER